MTGPLYMRLDQRISCSEDGCNWSGIVEDAEHMDRYGTPYDCRCPDCRSANLAPA